MLFYINHNGTEHTVRVESRRYKLYVSFDDGPEEKVDLAFFGNDCTFIRDNKVLFANVSGSKSDYHAWQSSRALKFKVETEYKRIVSKNKDQSLEEETSVRAKMPGKMVKILKKDGDSVSKGENVAVMEAMKMENDIISSASGKIQKVVVKEGQNVDAGELLMEIEEEKKD